eukprot:3260594-Rhodomonas_salina.1
MVQLRPTWYTVCGSKTPHVLSAGVRGAVVRYGLVLDRAVREIAYANFAWYTECGSEIAYGAAEAYVVHRMR